jgi:uncharacterized protein DUF1579
MIATLSLSVIVALQAAQAPPCRVGALDEAAFYPGKWRVTVAARLSARGPWEKTEGTSIIAPDLMGCAFIEHLDTTHDGKPLQLLSMLTYDRNGGRWQYTVTDSEHGRVLTYEGRRAGDAFVLLVTLEIPGGRALLRRTLRKESDEAFTWESARSSDQGKTWDVTTRFEYRRASQGGGSPPVTHRDGRSSPASIVAAAPASSCLRLCQAP